MRASLEHLLVSLAGLGVDVVSLRRRLLFGSRLSPCVMALLGFASLFLAGDIRGSGLASHGLLLLMACPAVGTPHGTGQNRREGAHDMMGE